MKVFDEHGNLLGEFIEDSKDKVSESFDNSLPEGCVCLLYMIPVIILLYVLWLLLGLMLKLCKLVLRAAWWVIRVPFCLIFLGEWPEF